MIETKVPKDIRSYKTKIVGALTFRQIICITIAAVVDFVLYFTVFQNLSLDVLVYAVIIIDAPILSFLFRPYGMPMEVYLKNVMLKGFLYPNKRTARTDLSVKSTQLMPQEKKKKIVNQMLKEHPELKPYK